MTTPEDSAHYPSGPQPLAKQRTNRRAVIATVAAVAVVILGGLGALLAVGLHHSDKKPHPAALVAAPLSVTAAVTSIPPASYETVGAGVTVEPGKPAATGGQPLGTAKPEVLFIGAQFCPFCAAERWAIVAALSRFGTFSHLDTMRSAEYDIETFNFQRTSYTSDYIAFAGREVEDQKGHRLAHLTAAQTKQWSTYLAPKAAGRGFPFLDVDGRYVITAAAVDANELLGKTAQQIATASRDPSSPIGKTVLGAANQLTAAICRVTDNQPAAVCTPRIQALGAQFPTYRH